MILRVFVTNLGAYNRGDLIGEWLELPTEEEEIQEVIERVLAQGEPGDEEVFITDWESDYFEDIHEYEKLEKLNEKADTLEQYVYSEGENIVKALLRELHDFEDVISTLENGNYCIADGITSEEDFGHWIVDNYYFDDISDYLIGYLDYRAIGRDYVFNGWVIHEDLEIAISFY